MRVLLAVLLLLTTACIIEVAQAPVASAGEAGEANLSESPDCNVDGEMPNVGIGQTGYYCVGSAVNTKSFMVTGLKTSSTGPHEQQRRWD